jgi:hypothetical protein
MYIYCNDDVSSIFWRVKNDILNATKGIQAHWYKVVTAAGVDLLREKNTADWLEQVADASGVR